MLPELDVAGLGRGQRDRASHALVPALEGVRFEPLDENDPRLYSLVGWDEKFAAHNAALWKHGLLVHVPKGVELEKPLYVRIANSVAGRLALLAAARRRRGGLALHADRGVRVGRARPARVHERRRRALRRAGREARVRLDPEPLARDLALRHAPRARRARRRARLGRGRLRLEEREDPHPERPERPRRDLARHRRVLRRRRRSTSTTTPSRSTSRRRPSPTSPSRARCARRRTRSGAG